MLELKNVSKTYKGKRGADTKALVDVSLKFEDTGLVFILGKSGCGKSTLMNVMGGLDKADSGEIVIMGKSSRDFSATDFLCLFVSEPLNCVRQLQFIKACRRCSVARQNKSERVNLIRQKIIRFAYKSPTAASFLLRFPF